MSGKETTFIPELSLNPDLSLKVTMNLFLTGALHAAECHVSILEDDGNEGPELKPFKTVSTAAAIAQVVGGHGPASVKKGNRSFLSQSF
jgi:hypothetical protein